MLISVIMPSFNSGPYIGQAIGSVLSQRGAEVELVIQDAGSTDGTLETIKSFDDPRIRLASEPDRGQADALNRALARSNGDWILWLNADDELAPGVIEHLAGQLQEPFDLVYGDCYHMDAEGRLTKRYIPGDLSVERLLTKGCIVFSGATFFRSRLLDQVGPFNADLSYCMDLEYFLRVASRGQGLYCPTPVAHFREHSASKTGGEPWKFFGEALGLRARYAAQSPSRAPLAAWGQLRLGAYILTRRVWLSSWWLNIKSHKRF